MNTLAQKIPAFLPDGTKRLFSGNKKYKTTQIEKFFLS